MKSSIILLLFHFALCYSTARPYELFNPDWNGKVDSIFVPFNDMVLITTENDSLSIDSIFIKNSNIDLIEIQFKLIGWIAKPFDSVYSISYKENKYGLSNGNHKITSPPSNFFYLDSFKVNNLSSSNNFSNCLLIFHFIRTYKDSAISNYDTLKCISKNSSILIFQRKEYFNKNISDKNRYLPNGRKININNFKQSNILTIKKSSYNVLKRTGGSSSRFLNIGSQSPE
jgi:hypothetical protein